MFRMMLGVSRKVSLAACPKVRQPDRRDGDRVRPDDYRTAPRGAREVVCQLGDGQAGFRECNPDRAASRHDRRGDRASHRLLRLGGPRRVADAPSGGTRLRVGAPIPELHQRTGMATAAGRYGQSPAARPASMASSSSSEPMRIGPLNQFLADSTHHPPKNRNAAPTVSGA